MHDGNKEQESEIEEPEAKARPGILTGSAEQQECWSKTYRYYSTEKQKLDCWSKEVSSRNCPIICCGFWNFAFKTSKKAQTKALANNTFRGVELVEGNLLLEWIGEKSRLFFLLLFFNFWYFWRLSETASVNFLLKFAVTFLIMPSPLPPS